MHKYCLLHMTIKYTKEKEWREYESQMTATIWSVHQAVWQENFDIS